MFDTYEANTADKLVHAYEGQVPFEVMVPIVLRLSIKPFKLYKVVETDDEGHREDRTKDLTAVPIRIDLGYNEGHPKDKSKTLFDDKLQTWHIKRGC
ncbi:hypothetical protein BGX27_004540 [Mortierella sp. AM989]|nr:hypothetical protein BGX27_004540 [Mortierella sp. AM989]